MRTGAFDQFASIIAILTGLVGLAYSVAFIIISRNSPELGGLLSALFLSLGGLFSSAAIIAVYQRVRQTASEFALLGLLLSLTAAFGSLIHGGYDLALAINPPVENLPALAGLPSQIDPRGLLTFGVAGIGLFLLSWLIAQTTALPRGLAYLGYLSALLLLMIYLARLIVLQPTNPVLLIPALLEGFIVNPVWYIWLGVALRRGSTVS